MDFRLRFSSACSTRRRRSRTLMFSRRSQQIAQLRSGSRTMRSDRDRQRAHRHREQIEYHAKPDRPREREKSETVRNLLSSTTRRAPLVRAPRATCLPHLAANLFRSPGFSCRGSRESSASAMRNPVAAGAARSARAWVFATTSRRAGSTHPVHVTWGGVVIPADLPQNPQVLLSSQWP